MKVRELSPKEVWNNFEDLNAVPRPSKKEERVIEFIKNFGLNLGLSTYVDPCGNVIIKKPASKGSENQKTVIIQSHLDVVHQKLGQSHGLGERGHFDVGFCDVGQCRRGVCL